MFRQHKNKVPIAVPKGVDWSRRSHPIGVSLAEGYVAGSRAERLRTDQVARENAAFLRARLANQAGVIMGFHGTTTKNAQEIMRYGFENRTNEEGLEGVSAWDQVVPHRALEFAERRSREAGALDLGRIVAVRMTNPDYDHRNARLEWLADAHKTEVLAVYTPEEMVQLLGGVAVDHIHVDAS